jgi:ParB/RepB/Spo0J family partition protein
MTTATKPTPVDPAAGHGQGARFEVLPLEQLREHPANPRKRFDPTALAELAASIREKGILNPLLVRPAGKSFEILAGARRFRAAKQAGAREAPVLVRELDDAAALELMIVDNLQREDIHPLEEAEGYRRLMGHGHTKHSVQWIADRVGRSVKYVYDRVKLLNLSKPLQELFLADKFTAGHAVILARLSADDQLRALGTDERGVYEGDGGLFEGESQMGLDVDDEGDDEHEAEDELGRHLKPVSVRELQGWVNKHVRFEAETDADPMLFPDTAQVLATAQEQQEKVVKITHDYYVQPEARSDEERTFGPMSWKRSDEKHGSKACDHAITGVIVAGPGRGDAFRVCIEKKKCRIHWSQEQKAAKARATAATGGRTGEDRWKIEERKRQEQQAREEAERARWKKATPEILKVLATAVKKAPARAGGLLGQVLVDYCKPDSWDMASRANAADYVARGTTAEDLVRHLAFTILVGEACGWRALDEFPKRAKAFGLDVRKLVDQVAPAPKAERPAAPPAKKKTRRTAA